MINMTLSTTISYSYMIPGPCHKYIKYIKMKRHNVQKYIPALEKNERAKSTIILQSTGVVHLVPLINRLVSSLTAKTGEANFSVPKMQ